MQRIVLIIFLLISSQSISQDVFVKGYYRKDGTYVQSHYRTVPNNTINDNWSTEGNINPYTGKKGWIERNTNYLTNYNLISLTEDQKYLINNCLFKDVDFFSEQSKECVELLLSEVDKSQYLKDIYNSLGLISDYRIFGLDLNRSVEKLVSDEIYTYEFLFAELFWVDSKTEVLPSNVARQHINFLKWDSVIYILPNDRSSRLKDVNPFGVILTSKEKKGRKAFNKQLYNKLIDQFNQPIHVERSSKDRFNIWVGFNFKVYYHYNHKLKETSVVFTKAKIYEEETFFN